MMSLQWLLGWWNLIYLAPFLIALTYLGVYVMTGMTFGDADVDADQDLSADHGDAGHDVEHDVGTDTDPADDLKWEPSADVQHAHGVDHANEHYVSHQADGAGKSSGFGSISLLQLIGFGKVPLSLMLMILLIAWGIGGFATNQLLHKTIADGDRVGLFSIPIAAVFAIVFTAIVTRVLHRTMPMNEAPTKSLPQLVGQDGIAILVISDTFGLAKVHDGSGVSIQVPCRVAPGQEPIAANRAVRLMRFDRNERVFYVSTPDRLETMRAAAVSTH